MKILIIGTGYVGTTTGLVFCEMGHNVTGLDLDERKVNSLQSGKLHFYEPGLNDLLSKHLHLKNITFTTDTQQAIKQNDVIFLCVGTPQSPNGSADLQYVKNAASSIGTHMNRYKVVVNKSTVPVGTAELVSNIIKENQTSEVPFDVVSNPEFLREGSALSDALHPDRVVIGSTSRKAAQIMKELYKEVSCPIIETNPTSAELIKYAANSFLALKISFMNELARLCDVLGINVKEVSKGIGLDHRIGSHFLQAGIGYGGSCFPKDVQALLHTSRQKGINLSILERATEVNRTQAVYFLEKIKDTLGDLSGKTIAVFGLAFKANTDDTRESPSLAVVDYLVNHKSNVKVHDPIVKLKPDKFTQCSSFEEAATGADAVIICTDWEEYRNLDWDQLKGLMKQYYIFDGRNIVDKNRVVDLGYHYVGIANG
ncbi:UDP-glucose dehydrogenase family protein [Bacillus sp. EB01]|uniref:UDP-glucose dehydrogenase family protein n=1 Tax=Bacillus sp. EB01 TaxID=1347086 RepID=UPI0009DF09EC|nr:UDP-glucose/GDP-mannose dehydrogenase family protein [Bacillus sp. EB01]